MSTNVTTRRGTASRERGGSGTITKALERAREGDNAALGDVVELAYEELSSLARSYLRREREDHTLDTCALVHEAYARLVGQRGVVWQNRRHFYGIAAQHMRRILCDYARRHRAEKRGGGLRPIRLHGLDDLIAGSSSETPLDDLLSLEQVLRRLEKRDADALEIVHLKCILGFKMTEISRETGISMRTLSRKWRWIRAWLVSELHVVESQPPL